MSSCLYGGGRTSYGNDLDFIKSPSTSTQTNHSSPSSTLSESSNSPLATCTRKPRTRRKRPNQTCNEAAALLSTAYPNIFSADDVSKPCKFIKPNEYASFSFEESSSELLLPFPDEKQASQLDPISLDNPCSIQIEETSCHTNLSNLCDGYGDFDTESILDEEIEEGVIDSIMGNLNSAYPKEENTTSYNSGSVNFCYGYPIGLGLGLWFGGRFDFAFDRMRGGVANAIRQTDGDWWTFPTVNVGEISPKFNDVPSPEKKKMSEKVVPKHPNSTSSKQNTVPASNSTSDKENSVKITKFSDGLLLKLNYDGVLSSWSDRGSPFSEDTAGLEFSGSDVSEKLAQIDLFGEAGALREASVQRYKEKKRTRLFSKKIRYQVRKVNADQRPRMKGRFVRSNSSKERTKKAKFTA